ncbi:MAG: hypothetical protein CFE46_13295 [Burkholderiales bacterium PBB6]|nr:MAG: hypothetical protein CFE46_13295 [Burkholderiales bacterium PBB6]
MTRTAAIHSIVDVARARIGNTTDDEARRRRVAMEELLLAFKQGVLAQHIAERSQHLETLLALGQRPAMLALVRLASVHPSPIRDRLLDVMWRLETRL